jgi:hypothetical protein
MKSSKRKFRVYAPNGSPMTDLIEAEQISQEGQNVGFYDASVAGNSRRLVAYIVLTPGQSVREER